MNIQMYARQKHRCDLYRIYIVVLIYLTRRNCSNIGTIDFIVMLKHESIIALIGSYVIISYCLSLRLSFLACKMV